MIRGKKEFLSEERVSGLALIGWRRNKPGPIYIKFKCYRGAAPNVSIYFLNGVEASGWSWKIKKFKTDEVKQMVFCV